MAKIVCIGKCKISDCPYKIRRELIMEAVYVDLRYTTMCKENHEKQDD